jgi:hypothetical protein
VTLTFRAANIDEVKKALPGMTAKGGAVDVDALLNYLRARMNGSSFYAPGNRVAKRLAAAAQARSHAKAIIERVRNGSRENRPAAGRSKP